MKTTAWIFVPVFLTGSALTLAPAWGNDQQQQKKNQNQPVRKQENRQPTLDSGKGVTLNDNRRGAPRTDDGVAGGGTRSGGPGGRTVPGGSATTSGTYKPPQQANTPGTPAGALYDPKTPRPGVDSQGRAVAPGAEGTTVTPGDFARDKQIKDLTDTKSALTEKGAKGGNAIPDKDKANPLGTTNPAGPARGEGRNIVDKTSQQSEVAVSGTRTASGGVVTMKGNRGEANWQIKDGKLTNETVTVKDKDATVTIDKNYETKTTVTTVAFTNGLTMRQVNDGEFKPTKTPNPETDTGDGRMPKGLSGLERPQKTPGEVAAERKRQTTLPLNDQRREAQRLRMDAETAFKSAADMRTAGRTNPVRGDGTTGGGTAPAGNKPPANPGTQQGRPGTPSGGARPGCPPDNPSC